MSAVSDPVKRLRRLDSCTVSDAMDKLGLMGAAHGLLQQSGTDRIAGQVVTLKVHTGAPPPGAPRHLGVTAIELSGPTNVIVVEQRTGVEAGCWGGLLTLAARARGVAGVIADGPVRDIDEARSYGFPIFTDTLTTRTARGRVVEQGTNVPIHVRDISVQPGDYVVADRSGVVFIPANRIAEVLDAAEMIAVREAAMGKAILAGEPIGQVLGGAYEHMLQAGPE
jgi:4-hydroxy-4-methyl-2-oxoglutarate aldolase